jgi:diacylglycerol kinase (ATP)
VVRTLAGLGVASESVVPGSPAEARPAVLEAVDALTRSGKPPAALVAVGGDGTVRLATGVAAGLGLPLGIIPAGTGNGVAYSLGLPLDAWEACRVVARGSAMPCDLGIVEFPGSGAPSEAFLNVAGAGLDAAITATYHEDGLGVRGVPGYVIAALRSLATYTAVPLDLELDGRPSRHEVLLVAIGNGAFYGKGVRIVPSAEPSDGLLDVLVVQAAGLADLSSLVPLLLLGRHTRHPRVRTYRAREITIRAAEGETARAVGVQADGDVIGRLPVRVSVRPGGIRVLR